jgi:SNF2 family DNA or RNA helicase
VPVFLLSLKAGGVGLNLTAADHVLLLDPWWNPAAEDQAADRAHRIGQTEPVTITRLVTAGTLEADILALQAEKRALVEATLSGTATAGALDGAQLAALIEGSDALRSRSDTDIPF